MFRKCWRKNITKFGETQKCIWSNVRLQKYSGFHNRWGKRVKLPPQKTFFKSSCGFRSKNSFHVVLKSLMYKEEKRYLLIDKSFPHTGCPLHTYLARSSLSFLSCSLSAGRMSSCSSAIASADVSSPCWAFREFIVASSLSSFSTKRLQSPKKKNLIINQSFFIS